MMYVNNRDEVLATFLAVYCAIFMLVWTYLGKYVYALFYKHYLLRIKTAQGDVLVKKTFWHTGERHYEFLLFSISRFSVMKSTPDLHPCTYMPINIYSKGQTSSPHTVTDMYSWIDYNKMCCRTCRHIGSWKLGTQLFYKCDISVAFGVWKNSNDLIGSGYV